MRLLLADAQPKSMSCMLVAVPYKQVDLDLIDQLNLFTDIFE